MRRFLVGTQKILERGKEKACMPESLMTRVQQLRRKGGVSPDQEKKEDLRAEAVNHYQPPLTPVTPRRRRERPLYEGNFHVHVLAKGKKKG